MVALAVCEGGNGDVCGAGLFECGGACIERGAGREDVVDDNVALFWHERHVGIKAEGVFDVLGALLAV